MHILINRTAIINYFYNVGCPALVLFLLLIEQFISSHITGSVYYYAILQVAIWWLCHMTALFWKIKFPFHAKRFEKSRMIHLLVVLLALFVPTIPVIASFSTGGFVTSNYPPRLCVSKSREAAYYTIVLPSSIILATGTSLLVMVLIIIIKVTSFITTNNTGTLIATLHISIKAQLLLQVKNAELKSILVQRRKGY